MAVDEPGAGRSPKILMTPLYMQVREFLLERITSSVWKPGSLLPSELDLAQELGVSPGTVRKALATLEADLIVSRRQGKGTFVNDSTSSEVAWRYDNIRTGSNEGVTGDVGETDLSVAPASELERERLGLAEGQQVIRLRRVRRNDKGRPYIYEEACLPEQRFRGLTSGADAAGKIVDLAQQFGVVLGRGVEDVAATVASDEIAAKLAVAPGTPLLRLDRQLFSIEGWIVEWRVASCHLETERYLVKFN